jgi:hypothetical protein
MAANIFDAQHYAEILTRIQQLDDNSAGKWGKMNLPQMLTHCGIQLKKALGLIPEGPTEGPAVFRTAMGRWIVLSAIPWPKGSATPADMNMEINAVSPPEVAAGKAALQLLLDEIQHTNVFLAHPFLGKLSKKEWGRMIWKHLDHHLRQFGG